MKKSILLFDLDGTLTDSAPGITNSAAYALRSFGIEVNPAGLRKFVGPPLFESFEKYYGFSSEEAKRAVTKYREYFADRGIFENEPYAGIKEMLQQFVDAGKHLLVATSKPVTFAEQILEHFSLASYFEGIFGSELNGTRTDKAEVIAYALEQSGIADKQQAVMIGDREYDILGARANGLDCIGVLYGYGSKEELEAAGATLLARTPQDLVRLLL